MRVPLRFPIRLKILATLLLVVTVVVSVITFAMANLFHDDKRSYVNDLASMIALSVADESRSLLDSYAERVRAYTHVMTEEQLDPEAHSELLQELFGDFPDLIGVRLQQSGEELGTAFDHQALEAAGLHVEDLGNYREDNPLPMERIAGREVFIENSTLSEKLPSLTMTLAVSDASSGEDFVVSAWMRLDRMLRIPRRYNDFEVYVSDSSRRLLAHRDLDRIVHREAADLIPEFEDERLDHSAGITAEFDYDGTSVIGGFAGVDTGDVIVGAHIPTATAYIASRSLLYRLMMIALGLLVFAAIAGLFWAYRITRPIDRLSVATKMIAKGQFDIKVNTGSRDEIGDLAGSFNRMASELKDRDSELAEAHAQLVQSEKLAAMGQLGAGIAHEVKNPLAGILGCAQLSLRKVEEGTPLRRNIELIEKETRRCKTIIENLLRFARQEKAVFEIVDVNSVAGDAAAIVNHQLELNKVHLEIDLGDHLPRIQGNGNQIQQVLMNLMINAQQAMDGKPGKVRLATSSPAPDRVEIRVSDTGPGIPEKIRKKVFEPFFTTKPGGKGTGLGLSVSYGIIKDHRGTIRVDNSEHAGAVFTISLPAVPSNTQETAEDVMPDGDATQPIPVGAGAGDSSLT